MAKKAKKITDYLKENSVQLTLQIIGFLVVVLNLWIASKLSPLASDISLITTRVQAIETQVVSNGEEHNNLVTKDTFNQVVTRIDHISGRVDQIYGLLK